MAAKRYRAISKCFGGGKGTYVHVDSDWGTYTQCRRYIIGRYGHIPPWAFISSITDYDKLQRKYGD